MGIELNFVVLLEEYKEYKYCRGMYDIINEPNNLLEEFQRSGMDIKKYSIVEYDYQKLINELGAFSFDNFRQYDLRKSILFHSMREHFCKKFCWAIPNNDALEVLNKYSPILEIGAGKGFWTKELKRNYPTSNIVCFDKQLPPNVWCVGDKTYFPVLEGNESEILNPRFEFHTLFLCWPPYASDVVDNCLRNLDRIRSNRFIYVGEYDAATAWSERLDDEGDWEIEETIDIPQWIGIHDRLMVWKRKELNKETKQGSQSMRDYITLGTTPTDEQCVQVGSDNYHRRVMQECHRYIELLKKMFPNLPEGCRFAVKGFDHDFGTYWEVVIFFNSDKEECVDFAINVENNLPQKWE